MQSRRKFIAGAAIAAGSALITRSLSAQTGSGSVEVDTHGIPLLVSPDFIGLSYENMQLEDASFFSPANTSLIAQFKAIAPHGVLRLGGNTSEFEYWRADATQPPPQRSLLLQDGSRPQDTLYAITPETIRALDGFLRATGWSCIYGLNLGFGSAATDLAEARFVSETLGPRLQYFQIGNEVDNFPQYHLREANQWNSTAYLKQWLEIARAVQKAIPGARFGLPDVASKVDWLTEIASQWATVQDKPTVTTLSHHYYWSGPPSNPQATVQRLLQVSPAVARQAAVAHAAAAKMNVQYRMTEGNTVYRGGKPGLSDVFAAALWAAEYLLELMQAGYSGVNLHGGSGHAQAVSVGGTFVGEADMIDPDIPHPKPFYTPIANEGTLQGHGVNGKLSSTYVLEPVGYGMKFVSSFAGCGMLPTLLKAGTVNAVAYAARATNGQVLLCILNKDEAQKLDIEIPPCSLKQVLTGPSLAAREAHLVEGQAASQLVKLKGGRVVIPPATGAMFLLT